MEEQEHRELQLTNDPTSTTGQQADPNASVGADMLGTERPTNVGVNVGSGYISGEPSPLPEGIADAEKSGKEFIPTGTADPAAGVIVDPNSQQGQGQQQKSGQ
jgi:hypothetical protein